MVANTITQIVEITVDKECKKHKILIEIGIQAEHPSVDWERQPVAVGFWRTHVALRLQCTPSCFFSITCPESSPLYELRQKVAEPDRSGSGGRAKE